MNTSPRWYSNKQMNDGWICQNGGYYIKGELRIVRNADGWGFYNGNPYEGGELLGQFKYLKDAKAAAK